MKLALVKKKSCIEVHNTKSNNPICASCPKTRLQGRPEHWPHGLTCNIFPSAKVVWQT